MLLFTHSINLKYLCCRLNQLPDLKSFCQICFPGENLWRTISGNVYVSSSNNSLEQIEEWGSVIRLSSDGHHGLIGKGKSATLSSEFTFCEVCAQDLNFINMEFEKRDVIDFFEWFLGGAKVIMEILYSPLQATAWKMHLQLTLFSLCMQRKTGSKKLW